MVNGAARAKDDAPDPYRDQEAAAQSARRGIWASLPPPPVTLQHPVVQDTATLVADGQIYVLNGLIGLGAPYAAQLQSYIAANGDNLTCESQIEPGEYICMLGDGTDIAKVALVNGAARVTPDAPDVYRAQQQDALNNHRGLWQNPPHDVLIAATAVQPADACCTYAAGDEGVDGVTYVGGEPEAVIDGAPVFLVFGGVLGWGYYDHWHHWHGAPDRYRQHLEHFHPDGRGLRGYGHNAEVRRDVAMHHEEALRRDAVLHPELAHPVVVGGAVHPGAVGIATPGMQTGRPGVVGQGVQPGSMTQGAHPGAANQGMHPGFNNQGMQPGGMTRGAHPGVANEPMHPGFPSQGVHPGVAEQSVHPGFSNQGVHPGVVNQNVHSGFPNQGGHPETAGAGVHPAVTGVGAHPGTAAAGAHPAMTGGFVHPGPSAAGFHPGAPTMHASAPVVHPSGGGTPPPPKNK